MHRLGILGLALCTSACGGIVQFEPAGEGGTGGDGGTSSNTSVNQTSNQSSSVNQSSNQSSSVNQSSTSTDVAVSTSTGPVTDCEMACLTLYKCGLEDGNCPGFTGTAAEEGAFLNGCLESCADSPVLVNLVDGGNCAQTIETFKGVSLEFQETCESGF